MVIIQRDRGRGHHQWKIRVDGFVFIWGLTKGEAVKTYDLLVPLESIVRKIVARERALILKEVQGCLDGLARIESDSRKAA